MTVHTILSQWAHQLLTDPRVYAELPAPIDWVPSKRIPNADVVTDYELRRTDPIEGHRHGAGVTYVQAGIEPTSRAAVYHRVGVSINADLLDMANQAGYQLFTNSMIPVLKQFQMQKAQIVCQGTTAARDNVTVNGLIDLGEDTDSALDDDVWDTAGNPMTHVKEGVKDLIANGYEPPYTWIMSYNLFTGFYSLHNAAGGLTEANLAFGTGIPEPAQRFIDRAVFFSNGTDASKVIYPLPAAANDDGVWIMCKPGVENFYIGEMVPLRTLSWVYNRDNNSYDSILENKWTLVVRDGNAAVYEPDVDLA